jgi:hypothetical protein
MLVSIKSSNTNSSSNKSVILIVTMEDLFFVSLCAHHRFDTLLAGRSGAREWGPRDVLKKMTTSRFESSKFDI